LNPPESTLAFARQVLAWQRTHGRTGMPWQAVRDPYRVWLSEIMLQQTQVATVLGYYARFLARFPTVQALAAAPQADVLALWSGLGYYSRARNLHRCAQAVVAQHGGRFPAQSAALATLPGIGRSTAAAIAAFCFDERAAVLDGNVKRVLARVQAYGEDLAMPRHEKVLLAQAEALLPPATDMPAYTQAMMDLGATVCRLREPLCGQCPVRGLCQAHALGTPTAFPIKRRKIKRSARHNAWLWLQWGEQMWLQQRPATGVWAGLLSLPEFGDVQALQTAMAAWPGDVTVGTVQTHVLTHLDWQLQPVRWRLPARMGAARRAALETLLGPGQWVTAQQALAAGVPAPLRKLLMAPALA
jgi:A/G-specific adenine glycosylase